MLPYRGPLYVNIGDRCFDFSLYGVSLYVTCKNLIWTGISTLLPLNNLSWNDTPWKTWILKTACTVVQTQNSQSKQSRCKSKNYYNIIITLQKIYFIIIFWIYHFNLSVIQMFSTSESEFGPNNRIRKIGFSIIWDWKRNNFRWDTFFYGCRPGVSFKVESGFF